MSTSTEETEGPQFRLLDPFLCLVCGAQAPLGIHVCDGCMEQRKHHAGDHPWGDRFGIHRTDHEVATRCALIELRLGVTRYPRERLQTADYTHAFDALLLALRRYLQEGAPSGQHRALSCAPDAARELAGRIVEAGHGESDFFTDLEWGKVLADACALCELDWRLAEMMYFEERHYGLPQGTLNEMRNRSYRDGRAATLRDQDLSAIVAAKMEGTSR